jgi:hypothetical protein
MAGPCREGADIAQPTNAITAEYLRQLHARRAPAGSTGPWRRRSELERLIDRTVLELHPTLGSCWVWTGTATPYGRIHKAQDTYTHRLGWKLLRGVIPKGKELHHRCERHACWNPDHLELVTHAQNRAYARRRTASTATRWRAQTCTSLRGASGSAGSAIGRPSGRFRRGTAPPGPLVSDPLNMVHCSTSSL